MLMGTGDYEEDLEEAVWEDEDWLIALEIQQEWKLGMVMLPCEDCWIL